MHQCLNVCYFGLIFVFSPGCRAKELGMLFTILGSFCSFLDWKRAHILPQNRPRKIPAIDISLPYKPPAERI